MQRAKECVQCVVCRRKHGCPQRPHGQGDGVQHSDQRAAEERRDQACNQEVILPGLPFLVAVPLQPFVPRLRSDFQLLRKWFSVPQRANPAAEETAQK